MEKNILGLVEEIEIGGEKVLAKVDTGATNSSISLHLASKLRLGPIVKTVRVISSHGRTIRPVIKVSIKLGGRRFRVLFNLTDRKKLKFPILIGQNILKRGFLIDPSKNEIRNHKPNQ
ncbi:ATP-dependent zinc protease [Candidatus Woesearchaeota archaeon]|nr:ATP-dependent zinc protease [Candidatus Woesearchaeota archaeon]